MDFHYFIENHIVSSLKRRNASASPCDMGTLYWTLRNTQQKTIFLSSCKQSNKMWFIHFVWFSLQGLPLFPKLDFGLGARVFSAVLLPLEPTIHFSHSPAVSHSKPRDFRLYEPAIPFYIWSAVSPSQNTWLPVPMSLRSLFPPGQRFPHGDVIDLLSTNQKPGNLLCERNVLLRTEQKKWKNSENCELSRLNKTILSRYVSGSEDHFFVGDQFLTQFYVK